MRRVWHVYLRVELYARMMLRCEFLFCPLTDASNEKYLYETIRCVSLVDFEGRGRTNRLHSQTAA